MKLLETLTICTLASAMTYGCSSSSGGGSTPASPNGIYTGSITGGEVSINGGEKSIIYNNRVIVFSTGGNIQQVFDSTISATDTTYTSASSIRYTGSNLVNTETLTSSGSFQPESSFTLNFSDASTSSPSVQNGTINLTFDSSTFNKAANLSTIATTWMGPYGFFATATISINTDGTFTGSEDSTGCTFNGTITVPDASINVYSVSVTSTGSCTSLPVGEYTGLAWVEGSSNETLNFSVSNSTNNRSLILTRN